MRRRQQRDRASSFAACRLRLSQKRSHSHSGSTYFPPYSYPYLYPDLVTFEIIHVVHVMYVECLFKDSTRSRNNSKN